jgi:hypothetical protein
VKLRERLVKGSMNLIDEKPALFLYGVMVRHQKSLADLLETRRRVLQDFVGKAPISAMRTTNSYHLWPRHARARCSLRLHAAPRSTTTAFIHPEIAPDGERTMNTYLGACVGPRCGRW